MKIGLQNFQGIGAYTEIPIAPITLFYGPNSAGKSTVADAFQFLHSTLSGENKDWKNDLEKHARRNRIERPLSEGYIGDPNDVVFTVGVSSGSSAARDGYLQEFIRQENELIDDLHWTFAHESIDQIFDYEEHEILYQVHFAKDEEEGNWLLRESLVIVDNQPLFKVHSHNYHAPESYFRDGICINLELAFNIYHPAYQQLEKLDKLIRWWFVEDGRRCHDEKIIDESLCWLTMRRISITDPFLFSPIVWQYNDWEGSLYHADDEVNASFRMLGGYLNFFMVMPVKWASCSVALYDVPPLRPLPENLSSLEIRRNINTNDYGCWEMLASNIHQIELGEESGINSPYALTFVNEILTSHNFLDTGYAIDGDVKFKFLLDINELTNLVQLDTPSRQKILLKTPAIVHLYLVYQPEGFHVEIVDVGVGISQVVPVLFGCWMAMIGWAHVHIQQPELHLHPKLQAQLADVFVKCVSAPEKCCNFLLESHSEHLLLRLLRRIRESHMAKVNLGIEAPEQASVTNMQKVKGHELKADQVSVVYVSKDESGITKMKPLRLSEDGEFIDRWPNGFFTERDIELFGEDGPFV